MEYPAVGQPASLLQRVNSTLLCSGINELRARGLLERYLELIDPAHGRTITSAGVGKWLPIETVMAHFRTCDAVITSADTAFEIGGASGKRVQEPILKTLVRLAAGAGATPWTIMHSYPRLWTRMFDGGTFTIRELGPKEAQIEVGALPIARFAYFRSAFRGANAMGFRLFASSVYVLEARGSATENGYTMRVSWA